MRISLLSLCVVCLFLSSCFMGSSLYFLEPDDPNAKNLVINPGFETADKKSPELPAGWLVVSTSTDQSEPVKITSEVIYAGRKSLQIENTRKNMYMVSEAFHINYVGGYYAKMSILAKKKMPKRARLYLWVYDAGGNKLHTFQKSIKGTTKWKKATISAGFLKEKATFARLAIFIPKDPNNTIWLDETGCYVVHKFSNK